MNLGESKQEQERAVSNSRKKWQKFHITSYIIISPSPSLSHFLSKDHNAKLFKFSAPNPNEKSKAGSYSNPDTGSSGWESVYFVQGVYMLPCFFGGDPFFFPNHSSKADSLASKKSRHHKYQAAILQEIPTERPTVPIIELPKLVCSQGVSFRPKNTRSNSNTGDGFRRGFLRWIFFAFSQ